MSAFKRSPFLPLFKSSVKYLQLAHFTVNAFPPQLDPSLRHNLFSNKSPNYIIMSPLICAVVCRCGFGDESVGTLHCCRLYYLLLIFIYRCMIFPGAMLHPPANRRRGSRSLKTTTTTTTAKNVYLSVSASKSADIAPVGSVVLFTYHACVLQQSTGGLGPWTFGGEERVNEDSHLFLPESIRATTPKMGFKKVTVGMSIAVNMFCAGNFLSREAVEIIIK